MKNVDSPLKIVKDFCTAWFEERSPERTCGYCSDNIAFVGTGENEHADGLPLFLQYVQRDLEESQAPFTVNVISEEEHCLTESSAIVTLEFDLKSADYILHIHGTHALTREAEGWRMRYIHYAVPSVQQEEGEHYPLTLIKKKIDDTRQELLSSSIAGGLMGGYVEDNFPFYYINERMLSYLGYDSEEDFVRDNNGYIINCMHPDDRQGVDDAVDRQLAENDEYTVEYRMRKKNGSYIYVHDIGRVITAEDGRKAIISVCMDVSDQQFVRQQNDNMINALSGSMFLGTFCSGQCNPIYASKSFGNLLGYTQKEMLEIVSKDFSAIIHPMDRERFMDDQRRVNSAAKDVEGIYCALHRKGHYVWIAGICQYAGEENGFPTLRYVFASRSKQFEQQNKIFGGIDTGIIVIDAANDEVCLANETAFQMMGKPVCDYYGHKRDEILGEFSLIYDACLLRGENDAPEEVGLPGSDRTAAVTVKNADWMDRAVRVMSITDITEQKKIQEQLRLGEQRLTAAIKHAGLQFWEYDMQDDMAYMSEISQQYYGLPPVMENFPESFLELGMIHEDDVYAYRNLHRQLKEGETELSLEYRIARPGNEYKWMMMRYTTSFDEKGIPMRAFATAESVDRLKSMEEGYAIAAEMTGARIWTVDLEARTILFNTPGGAVTGQAFSCRTEEEFRKLTAVAPEDTHTYWEKMQEIFTGNDDVSFRVRLKTGDKYRWNRVVHTILRTKGGRPLKAIGVSIDIHEHILLEQRFEKEMEYSSQLQAPNLITKVRCNITSGTVDLYSSTDNTAVTHTGANYEEGAENLALAAVDSAKQNEIRYYLNRERVIKAYAGGESSYEIVYLRRGMDNTVFWAHTVVKTYQDPTTGDLMSFIYTFNIDEQKMSENIVNRVVDTHFEYISLINAVTGKVERTIDKAGVVLKPEAGVLFDKTAERLIEHTAEEERHLNLSLIKIDKAIDQLKKNDTYSISFDVLQDERKGARRKLWVFNWFDDAHTMILCSRSDITEAYQQEQRQKQALSAALEAANQANVAKSDFLSRMSHEIRTPMNAIIGMTAIAAKSMGNDQRISDCLNKIDTSSHFLLSLINDILDMSRIESGKASLKSEKTFFHDFIDGVNAICYTQAEAKGIDYECIISRNVKEWYIVDAMKLQQVLVNILGNAVKFTDRGGKVTLYVEQLYNTGYNAALRFIISDTGIGIDEEFLTRLFRPFEQESGGITVGYGGTGLGLAISKSIVEMMDGSIEVCSEKGSGTEFTVDVKLKVPEKTDKNEKKQISFDGRYPDTSNKTFDFTGKRLLLAEDNLLNAEIAEVLLTDAGFIVNCVENGQLAVDAFAESSPGYYDAVLMDIRMPVMDGLQASACIRKLANEDAKTIPIIAMTADAFDEDAEKCRVAGMNYHMSKPVEPQKLYQILFDFIN